MTQTGKWTAIRIETGGPVGLNGRFTNFGIGNSGLQQFMDVGRNPLQGVQGQIIGVMASLDHGPRQQLQ